MSILVQKYFKVEQSSALKIQILVATGSAIAIISYFSVVSKCTVKQDCNEVHAYISVLAVTLKSKQFTEKQTFLNQENYVKPSKNSYLMNNVINLYHFLFLKVIGYLLLRNCHPWLRKKYSKFFAIFGKFSLELFIAQYHIWMANNTHGKTIHMVRQYTW